MSEQVLLIPEKTCAALETMVIKRQDQIAELRDEISVLEYDLEPNSRTS